MKKVILFLIPFIRPNKSKAILAILLSLPLAAIKGCQVKLVQLIVDSLTQTPSFEVGLKYALILFGLGILNYPCRFFHFFYMRYVVDSGICKMREQLFSKFQKLPMEFFLSRKSGAMVSNIFNDISVISQGFKSLVDFAREPLATVMLLGMAIYHDWQLSIIVFLVAPLFVLIFTKTGKLVRHNQNMVQEELSSLMHFTQETLSGQKIVKSLNLQQYVIEKFKKLQTKFFHFQVLVSKVEEHSHPMVELIGSFAFGVVICFAYFRVSTKAITTGDFFSFVTALALVMDPLRKFSQANVSMNQARAAYARLEKVFTQVEEKDFILHKDIIQSKAIDNFSEINFKNLTFAYQQHDILKSFNLTVKKGEKVALVGVSGAGKSTLVNLLMRFFDGYDGGILIDGKEIRQFPLQEYRNLFGYVGQENFLFHDSIKENIILGRTHSAENLDECLRVSFANEFIQQLPEKLDTMIGDRGMRMSGGQCQRLSMARALLQGPDILIFDEATSALDNESEERVKNYLAEYSKGKTIFCIAHRLKTIRDFDKIVVMKDGKKVEEGNHQDLLAMEGEYWKLLKEGEML